jgi:hypothetical protein
LRVGLDQLREVKLDRHVQIFLEMGRRWEGREMTEALQREKGLTPQELREIFDYAERPRSRNPFRERKYTRAARETVVLLRIPNYFEDAAMVTRVGGLDESLVLENFGGVAIDEWRRWSLTVKAMQEEDELAYMGFEQLVGRAEKEDRAREEKAAT